MALGRCYCYLLGAAEEVHLAHRQDRFRPLAAGVAVDGLCDVAVGWTAGYHRRKDWKIVFMAPPSR
jgi:hypothetical protein